MELVNHGELRVKINEIPFYFMLHSPIVKPLTFTENKPPYNDSLYYNPAEKS